MSKTAATPSSKELLGGADGLRGHSRCCPTVGFRFGLSHTDVAVQVPELVVGHFMCLKELTQVRAAPTHACVESNDWVTAAVERCVTNAWQHRAVYRALSGCGLAERAQSEKNY
jgi:hypothetical protein